ncbi:Metallo-dependent phosphatase [Trichodelitschia bisporula]|uniref:Metallo-dependent phosphatase n=1 Tax=Trichodelitschia bisporula TaxID=703511 RepID=A0A6G1HXW6_9PEZI|nr:Metallo-dependent phosphatase [Trichodelitschia bisporula]
MSPRRASSTLKTGANSPLHPPPSPRTSSLAYSTSHPMSPGPQHNRPLIDFVTNEWQYAPDEELDDSDREYFEDKKGKGKRADAPPLPKWVAQAARVQIPRRVQRWAAVYTTLAVALWLAYSSFLKPAWEEEKRLDRGMAHALREGVQFGANIRPTFAGLTHLKKLDDALVPGRPGSTKQRLVFVGDVHGCKDELQALLDKINFNSNTDHLILTGDLIAKGPDSTGAVDLARRLHASCVRGNHEDRVLLAHASLHASLQPLPGPAEDPNTAEDDLDEESFSHGDYRDRAIAKKLSRDQVQWLTACPVVLQVGSVGKWNGGTEVLVVHAGLVPGVDVERQDPFLVMNMRSVDLDTLVPRADRKGEEWEKLWNHHEKHTHPASSRITVVYGHDSKRGLNLKKYSKGLDTGCVNGERLTGLVVRANGHEEVVSVPCGDWQSQKAKKEREEKAVRKAEKEKVGKKDGA